MEATPLRSVPHLSRSPRFNALLALFIATAATGALAADTSKQERTPQTISALLETLPTVTVSRNPSNPNIVAVYAERDPQWWGRLAVYHRSGDVINWAFTFPKSYEESRGHYVVRFRWISLRQTAAPVLEVIESTHKGNGSLRLFETGGRELRLLLDTVVRGRFWSAPAAFGVPENGEAYFEGSHLGVEYQSPTEHSADSILLTGSVRIEDVQGRLLPSRRFAQAWVWDAAKRVFVAQIITSP